MPLAGGGNSPCALVRHADVDLPEERNVPERRTLIAEPAGHHRIEQLNDDVREDLREYVLAWRNIDLGFMDVLREAALEAEDIVAVTVGHGGGENFTGSGAGVWSAGEFAAGSVVFQEAQYATLRIRFHDAVHDWVFDRCQDDRGYCLSLFVLADHRLQIKVGQDVTIKNDSRLAN